MIPLLYGLLLIIGLILLWLSSDKAVLYASQAAGLFGISKLFVGFVLLAVSTGLPELLVAIQSLIAHTPLLSVGDIIGSNFADISLSLGIPALFIGPIMVKKADYKKQLIMLLLSSFVMFFVFINGQLTKAMGIFLLLIYVTCIVWLWKTSHVPFKVEEHEQFIKERFSNQKNSIIFKLLFYLILVIIASKICIESALALANTMEMPLDVLGVSIIAFGTSLPEISLNIHAIKKKKYSLAIGNSFGSIFSQGALILGLLATFSPSPLPLEHLYPIIPFICIAYGITGYHILFRKKIGKPTGLILTAIYALFMIYELLFY